MQNQERDRQRVRERNACSMVGAAAYPTSAHLPLSVYNCAALSRRARECISCTALYANFKAHLCGASDDVGDEKPKKEEKQQKKGRGKSLHNLANKQASKSQQTAGIVLLSLLATDARYLKTLKQHTRTHTHMAHTQHGTCCRPSPPRSLWLVCESLKVNNLKASGGGEGTRSLRHLNHVNTAKRNGLCPALGLLLPRALLPPHHLSSGPCPVTASASSASAHTCRMCLLLCAICPQTLVINCAWPAKVRAACTARLALVSAL